MIDLKNMSVDQLRSIFHCLGHHADFEDIFSDMARRLREQEQMLDLGPVAALIKRAEQAESALLACQAREAELRDVLKDADEYLSASPLNQIGSGSQLHREMQVVLSHSTGSKIMAVVEAAKKFGASRYTTYQSDEEQDLHEAVRALEAKHD